MNLKNYSFFAIFNTFIGISFISFYLYLGVNFDTTIILAIISTDSFKLLIFSKLIFKENGQSASFVYLGNKWRIINTGGLLSN